MSYTDMDIEMKALSMLGSNVPDEDAQMLRTVCTAAAAELEGRLRRGVSSDDTRCSASATRARAQSSPLTGATASSSSARYPSVTA